MLQRHANGTEGHFGLCIHLVDEVLLEVVVLMLLVEFIDGGDDAVDLGDHSLVVNAATWVMCNLLWLACAVIRTMKRSARAICFMGM